LKLFVVGTAAGALLLSPVAATAGEATDKLGQCMVENSSPRDQAALMRWMFSALALNPALKSMASLSAEQRDDATKAAASLFNRLMLQDCRKEAVSAMRADGSKAIEGAFSVLGERAAEQLLSDGAASTELQKLGNFLDEAKWGELAKEGGVDR